VPVTHLCVCVCVCVGIEQLCADIGLDPADRKVGGCQLFCDTARHRTSISVLKTRDYRGGIMTDVLTSEYAACACNLL